MPEIIHKQIDHVIEEISKNWPNIKDNDELKKYT